MITRPKSFALIICATSFLFTGSVCLAQEVLAPVLRNALKRIDYLSGQNNYDAALPIAEVAVKQYPNSVEARMRRGLCLLYMEEEEKAIEDFLWILKTQPKNVLASMSISAANYRLSRLDPALKYINIALANATKDSERAECNMRKKDILKQLHRYKEAQQCNTEALKMFKSPHWYLERLKLASINGDWKTCLSDSEHLLPLMPKFRTKILHMRAQGLIGLKRYSEAEKILNDIIKQSPDNRDFLLERSKMYMLVGKKDLADKDKRAIRDFDESL